MMEFGVLAVREPMWDAIAQGMVEVKTASLYAALWGER